MNMEDCTKEELIWYIKNHVCYDEKELVFHVLLHRSGEISKLAYQAGEEAGKALARYTDALRPYETYKDIPDKVIQKAVRDFKEYEKYTAVSERYHRQYERIQKQINKLL